MKQIEKCLKILIFGMVQGVFFRSYAKETADRLNIKGFTRNIPDGAVEIVAMGEERQLEKFLKLIKVGPPLAKIDKIEVSPETLCDFIDFSIETS